MVLLKCESSLKNSIFSYDYNKEFLYCILDNLNLLYVAATRAINNLYIIMPYKEEIKRPGNVAELVQSLIEHPFLGDSIDREKYSDFGKFWDSDRKIFELGSMETNREQD